MKLNLNIQNQKRHKAFKIYFIALSCFMFLSLNLLAQPNQPRKNKQEEIEKAKVAYITQRLSMNPVQAEKFWPMYNDYNDRKIAVKKVMRKLKIETRDTTLSDDQIRQDIKAMLECKQKLLDIEKESMDRYLKVLSPSQAVNLIKAERGFIKLLYKKMEED
jgi:hypothetical protein